MPTYGTTAGTVRTPTAPQTTVSPSGSMAMMSPMFSSMVLTPGGLKAPPKARTLGAHWRPHKTPKHNIFNIIFIFNMSNFLLDFPWNDYCFRTRDPDLAATAVGEVVDSGMRAYIPYSLTTFSPSNP